MGMKQDAAVKVLKDHLQALLITGIDEKVPAPVIAQLLLDAVERLAADGDQKCRTAIATMVVALADQAKAR